MGGHDLGRFDHLLLLAVMRLGDAAYGMTIRRELAEHTGREVAAGAIYTALARLERAATSDRTSASRRRSAAGAPSASTACWPAGAKAVERAEAAFVALGRVLGRDPGRS